MRMVIGLLFVFCLCTDGTAAGIARVEPRAKPMRNQDVRTVTARSVRQETCTGDVHAVTSRAAAAAAVLNCENDNLIAPATTLRLLPGDMAGNIFAVDPQTAPFVVDSVALGLLPHASSTLPVLIGLDIFVYDPQQDSFLFEAGFDITIDTIDPDGTILDVDLSSFDVEGDNDLLTLYGDFTNTNVNDMVNPAGDASPRCLSAGGDNACSVLLPFDEEGLFLYGTDDTECPSGTMIFDLVHEVTLAPVVATQASSWSGVKARY